MSADTGIILHGNGGGIFLQWESDLQDQQAVRKQDGVFDAESMSTRTLLPKIASGRERLAEEVLRITDEALESGWSLEMRTLETDTTKPYRDLVPLGFLGAALRVITESDGQRAEDAKDRLGRIHDVLESNRCEGIWGCSTRGITASVDTALISLSGVLTDIESVERLRGMGKGFIPQLIADYRPGIAISSSSSTDYLAEEDVPTTALLEALRIDVGLETKTDALWYLSRYPRWGGLYFNNPALSIWAVARIAGRLKPFEKMAEELIQKDKKSTKENPHKEEIAERRQRRELRKIITARLMSLHNESGSFGRYDPILTNAFAVLALDELSLRGQLLFSAQAHVLDAWEQSTTAETLFHSTLIFPQAGNDEEIARQLRAPGRRMVGDRVHAISTYEDPHRLIVSAAACLALHVNADPEERDVPTEACTHLLASSPIEQACLNVAPYCERRQEFGSGLNGPFTYPARRASILDCTTSILRKLGSQLVSTESQTWLEHMASSTIDEHIGASTFGLEIRLHERDATIDFLWHASRSSQNISALLNSPDDSSNMRHLAKLWDQNNEDGKPAIAFIDNIWFEFDHDATSELPPGFFFGPSNLTKDVEKVYGVGAVARNVRRVVRSLRLEASHEAQMLSAADRIAELPTDWPVFQVGLMFSRSDSPIRLCFAPKNASDVSTSALVDWPEIEHLVRSAEDHGHKTAVCIDVSDHGVSKRVGLELHYSNVGIANTHLEDLRNLFNAFLELGIVSASRCESFINIEGWEEINSHGGVNARMNHIKCVVQPGLPVEVKGYLALMRTRRPNLRI